MKRETMPLRSPAVGIYLRRGSYGRFQLLKPNIVGAVVLILIARDNAQRELSVAEMQKASGFSWPGWQHNREAVLATLRDCYDVEPAEQELNE